MLVSILKFHIYSGFILFYSFAKFKMSWNGLLDFDCIPGGMVSGLEESDIQNLIDEYSILDGIESTSNICLPDDIRAEMDAMEIEEETDSSKIHVRQYVKKFKDFLVEKKLSPEIESMEESRLAEYLRYFYSSLRKQDGGFFSPSSLGCIRAALHRYLTSAPVSRPINLMKDATFLSANKMLKALASKYIKTGGKEKRFDSIEKEDLIKLRNYFQRENPTQLQDEVIFNILLHFGQRGREHLRLLTKSSISFSSDSDGRDYAFISEGLPSKNRRASIKRSDYEDFKQARMYANPEESEENCPLQALKLYISKMNANESLFPKPLNKFNNTVWYSTKAVRGKDWLGRFMSELSKKAKLSKQYTNHCIRVTTVSKLHDSGFNLSDISAVTGHKSEAGVKRYIRYKDDRSLATFSNALSAAPTGSKEMKTNEFTITEAHKLKISYEKNFARDDIENDREKSTKKARLHTSWGLLEIDL